MVVAKYTNGPVKLFGGYEFIRYAPPSNPYPEGAGFTNISGDFVCAGCTAINNTNINSNQSPSAFTVNTLRFNTASTTLTLTGANVVVTPWRQARPQ